MRCGPFTANGLMSGVEMSASTVRGLIQRVAVTVMPAADTGSRASDLEDTVGVSLPLHDANTQTVPAILRTFFISTSLVVARPTARALGALRVAAQRRPIGPAPAVRSSNCVGDRPGGV